MSQPGADGEGSARGAGARRALLAAFTPPPLVVEEAAFDDALDPLAPAELEAVARAGDKRRTEFRAGRHCARRALARLGFASASIPAAPSRMPLWPAGVVGSISHAGTLASGHAVAVVARESDIHAVGVDIERERSLDESLWDRVLTDTERRLVGGLPELEQGSVALLLFSIKECVYKGQYPLFGERLEFLDVEVSLDLERERFVARCTHRGVHELLGSSATEGHFRRYEGWVASLLLVRR